MIEDLTPGEVVAAIDDITKLFPNARHNCFLMGSAANAYWHIGVKPFGWGSGLTRDDIEIVAKGGSLIEAVTNLRADFEPKIAALKGERCRKMALAIIDIRMAVGEVTPAALRQRDFTDDEIATLGPAAVADANAIADNGPFEIVQEVATPNGAPADDEAEAPAHVG